MVPNKQWTRPHLYRSQNTIELNQTASYSVLLLLTQRNVNKTNLIKDNSHENRRWITTTGRNY